MIAPGPEGAGFYADLRMIMMFHFRQRVKRFSIFQQKFSLKHVVEIEAP